VGINACKAHTHTFFRLWSCDLSPGSLDNQLHNTIPVNWSNYTMISFPPWAKDTYSCLISVHTPCVSKRHCGKGDGHGIHVSIKFLWPVCFSSIFGVIVHKQYVGICTKVLHERSNSFPYDLETYSIRNIHNSYIWDSSFLWFRSIFNKELTNDLFERSGLFPYDLGAWSTRNVHNSLLWEVLVDPLVKVMIFLQLPHYKQGGATMNL